MSKITEKQILYIFEHNIKDVCKIGIGTLERAKNAHRYFESNEKSKKNKLAIFDFNSHTTSAVDLSRLSKNSWP